MVTGTVVTGGQLGQAAIGCGAATVAGAGLQIAPRQIQSRALRQHPQPTMLDTNIATTSKVSVFFMTQLLGRDDASRVAYAAGMKSLVRRAGGQSRMERCGCETVPHDLRCANESVDFFHNVPGARVDCVLRLTAVRGRPPVWQSLRAQSPLRLVC